MNIKTTFFLFTCNLLIIFNLKANNPQFTSLRETMEKCQALPGQTYAHSCDEWYEKFIDQINVRDEYGFLPITSPINVYSKYNKAKPEEIVSALIRHGANLELKDRFKKNALLAAINNNCPTVTQILINAGVDIESTDKYGNTPLFKAISKYTLILEEEEEEERKKIVNNGMQNDLQKRSKQSLSVLKTLIAAGVNINAPAKYGKTILHQIAYNNNPNHTVIKLLIAAGANINAKDDYNQNPIASAINFKNIETAATLAWYGFISNLYGNKKRILRNQLHRSNKKTKLYPDKNKFL